MNILKLEPCCKNYIWGGTRLPEGYGKRSEARPVAESWELSLHPDGETQVNGVPLHACVTPEALGENCAKFSFFPMLIKLIDAKENLSVQVHPDDSYALARENSLGKTEAWYIVEAAEGAGIYLGFRRAVSREEVERAIAEGTLCELMNFYPVRQGECYFIPAGTIHAIGAGCLIYEVQQNSNLTYRVYDYNRRDKNGNLRELHVEKALQVLRFEKHEKPAPSPTYSEQHVLAECPYFRATQYTVSGSGTLQAPQRSFLCITCVKGQGTLAGQAVCCGDSFFVPAGFGELLLTGEMQLVCAEVPHAAP